MRLPFLRPKTPAPTPRRRPAAGGDPAALEAARTRARRRLTGALVLLAIGVVGFPILFETQPRPLPVDTPIEVPRREAALPPPAAPPAPPAPLPRPAPRPLAPAPVETEATATPTTSAEEVPAAQPAAVASGPASRPPVVTPAPAAVEPAPAAPTRAPAATAPTDDAARARALLEGEPASAPAAARYVVQVGAYNDAATLRDARAKVEKLGLKTYVQVIESDAGHRTRVRVGPFATRNEADAAVARLKRGGMPANVLTL